MGQELSGGNTSAVTLQGAGLAIFDTTGTSLTVRLVMLSVGRPANQLISLNFTVFWTTFLAHRFAIFANPSVVLGILFEKDLLSTLPMLLELYGRILCGLNRAKEPVADRRPMTYAIAVEQHPNKVASKRIPENIFNDSFDLQPEVCSLWLLLLFCCGPPGVIIDEHVVYSTTDLRNLFQINKQY